ncbi:hypothetical protein [Methylobacterium sp. Leaf117]|uniref:hypothetical protein n=1 Tax=Methylobacterium sp. Leaf117 TaxID=1736260 RepID=UPI0006FE874B|nr:hypothetical protein [Methylobacterium sp. Leaf117]KQP90783.1 hypothetical protein ASF57_23540 [Methylobacterium sp. Leaf117]
MSKPTIDTAIAAWKAAATQADRDLAATAIEEHIAHETPEGGDYEFATAELIERLKAECGPLTEPDARTFFIAVPGGTGTGIFGIGMTEEGALADAYRESQTRPAAVSLDEDGDWVVSYEGTYDAFPTEEEAKEHAASLGFVARPCTERLYDHIDDHGCDATTFRWDQSGAPGRPARRRRRWRRRG